MRWIRTRRPSRTKPEKDAPYAPGPLDAGNDPTKKQASSLDLPASFDNNVFAFRPDLIVQQQLE